MANEDFAFFPIQLRPKPGRQSLYMCGPFPTHAIDGLLIRKREQVSIDGVMNSLYDRELFPFVGGKQLVLQVEVQGPCRVLLVHRTAGGQDVEHGARMTAAALLPKKELGRDLSVETVELEFEIANSEQNFGRWFFRVEAQRADAKLLRATWLVRDLKPATIVPAFIICTFKRERQVAGNVEGLLQVLGTAAPAPVAAPPELQPLVPAEADLAAGSKLPVGARQVNAGLDDFGVIVVDNAGTLTEDSFPSPKVQLIRQRNVGGAGGFGRGIFEALQSGRFTHIIMLDDDADIDDVSITRMMNLLRLSNDPKLFVGGLQFDTYDQCRLADAGAYWTPERFERPIARIAPADVGTPEGRDALAHTHNSNFNGWWLFGGRVESFRTYGMPLPCFVHLDDVEYGVRVQLNGGRTVTVPGIAVWHEPYYAKVEGWFAYYNIRNELIRLSAQTPMVLSHLSAPGSETIERRSQARVASVSKRLRTRFRDFVNTYQYGSAMLLARAVEDFCAGADLLRTRDAEALHNEVMGEYRSANKNLRLAPTLPAGLIPERPARGGKLYRIAQIYLRNGNRAPLPGRNDAARLTLFRNRADINWKLMRARQSWAYPDPAAPAYHIYAFDHDIYRDVDARFRKAIKLFDREAKQVQVSWSSAYAELTSLPFWENLVRTF